MQLGAEFVGTFILIFTATAGPIVNQKYDGAETLIGNAACAGLAVMIIILSTGHISGAHLNPSLTIAFAALRHFPWAHVPAYIAAQVSASVCASFALKAVFHPFMSGGVTVPSVSVGQAFALEFIISFILLFVVTAVATDTRAVGELAGIAVGATVMLNILVAGPSTGASMNPVRTLGPALASGNYRLLWVYLVAPTLGCSMSSAVYYVGNLPPARVELLGAVFVGTFILIFTATAGPIVNQKYDRAETLIASICASFALKAVFHPFMSGGVTVPSVSVGQAFALEFIISFILLFVITAVATDTRAVGELAGIAVGATVMLNNLVAGPSSGASMNPVRTLGPALASGNYRSLWVYLVAPTLGAISGAAVYTGVKLNDNVSDPPRQVRSFRR
ncbi:hypothetical protein F2Q69_00002603 [Brassica cretica]|nr:hypothetical protein F2Q69_00002603 [Brassica cretica]